LLGAPDCTRRGGRFRNPLECGDRHRGINFSPANVSEIPVPDASSDEQKDIIKLVTKILAAKAVDTTADTSAMEAEIDQLVYQLYGLTAKEIAIVEGQ